MTERPRVRRARAEDLPGLVPLVHMPAEWTYERLAGSRERALPMIEAQLRSGLVDATWVAEVEGSVAGAMVAYPYRENAARARGLLYAALRHSRPWRWPLIARVFWQGNRQSPGHPADSLYVDALAVAPGFRRRGVAGSLLEHAAQTAANNGLRSVSLDTAETNAPAVALYRSAGFEVAQVVPERPPMPAILAFRRDV